MGRDLTGARTVCSGQRERVCREGLAPSLRQPHASSLPGVPWPFTRQTLRVLRLGLWCCWGPAPVRAQGSQQGMSE